MCRTIVMTGVLISIIALNSACGQVGSKPPPIINPSQISTVQVEATSDNLATSTKLAIQLEEVVKLDLPGSFINTVVFSPDGSTLITADWNGEVQFWDKNTWEKKTILQPHPGSDYDSMVYFGGTLVQLPDGNGFITATGENGEVTVRDREGKELFTFYYEAQVYTLALSPDGKFVAVGGDKNAITVYDITTRELKKELVCDHEYISNLVFSPDAKLLVASYERPGNSIKFWDTVSWQETATFTHTAERFDYHDMVFTPDSANLVLATNEVVEIKFIDLATMQIRLEISEQSRAPYQLAFWTDGSLLASASDDNALRLWDANTGDLIRTIRTGHEAGAVAFSPDGTLIAFSVWGEGVQVWSVKK